MRRPRRSTSTEVRFDRRTSLHRRDDRRSDAAGRQRALSDDDRPRRISAVAARRQCDVAARARRRSARGLRLGAAPARRSSEHFALRGASAGWADDRGRAAPTRSTRPMSSGSSASGKSCSATRAVWIPGRPRLCGRSRVSRTRWSSGLSAARPETLDQASRIPGVTPAALSALYVAASRRAAA